VASGHESVSPLGVIEASGLLVAVGLSCYALSLLVAQLAAVRVATAAAGVLLLALFLLNSLSRVFDSLSTWRWLSPFRYYDLSQPLPPGGHFEVRALLVLVGVSVVATAAAAAAFEFRDLGSALVRVPAGQALAASNVVSGAAWWR